jgi:hypothetical protein
MTAAPSLTLGQLAASVLQVADLLGDPLAVVARERVTLLEPEVRDELAALFLAEQAGNLRRTRTLETERAAATRDEPLGVPMSKAQRKRLEREVWRRDHPDEAQAHDEAIEAIDRRFTEEMLATIGRFRDELRIEWTRDLLDASIALPDGRVTTWGEATVDEHEARAELFTRNAIANAEGAARHRQAIDELNASGARTLRELVGVL